MLTDDPGTVEPRHCEINTSVNSQLNKYTELEAPLLDINFGLNIRTQLKFEMPYVLSNETSQNLAGTFGKPMLGIKYRFVDGDSDFMSVSTYPQIAFSIQQNEKNEYKMPLQFEKRSGKFIIGDEIGYLNAEKKDFLFDGILVGMKFTGRFEMMGEMYFIITASHLQLNSTMINLGARYQMSAKIIALCSFGTDVQDREKEERKSFFSYTGIQWLF